jgi:hypothetical protein
MFPVHYELWFTNHIQRNIFETRLTNSPVGVGLCYFSNSEHITQCFPVNDLSQAPKTEREILGSVSINPIVLPWHGPDAVYV